MSTGEFASGPLSESEFLGCATILVCLHWFGTDPVDKLRHAVSGVSFMSLSNEDLLSILLHCRELLAASNDLKAIKVIRSERTNVATKEWRGPHAITFGQRIDDEVTDVDARIAGLKSEADAWAKAWADTINKINSARRKAAVEAEKNRRGFGESFVDVFVSDDSDQMVRSYTAVEVPTASTNYTATGELETFG